MKNNYSLFEQLLHKISVGNPLFNEISFDVEKSLYLAKIKNVEPNVIFISGLARSGTTSLLNHLVKANVGHSLSYRDLPFLFMPNLSSQWRRNKSTNELVERAHGDNIMINEDSPEAIDEVFWKHQLCDKYIQANQLVLHELNENDLVEYKNFIMLHAAKSGHSTYLTKNNNSILRLNSFMIQSVLDTKFLFAIREPYSHARSLLKQHVQFSTIHQNDAFSQSYFNSLGHHEFGLNLKSFNLGDSVLNEQIKSLEPNQLDYWLQNWFNYYQYLVKNYSDQWLMVDFEDLCLHPTEIMQSIRKTWCFPQSNWEIKAYKTPKYNPDDESYSENLFNRCQELYLNLKKRCIAIP